MSKYVVETFYTCTFKIVHKLDELNEKKLAELENRKDGEVQIIDVRLNNRKTKIGSKNEKTQISDSSLKMKGTSSISTILNEKISASSDKPNVLNDLDNKNLNIQKLNKKNSDRSKMPDRRKGYIQKVSIGDHKIYLHT